MEHLRLEYAGLLNIQPITTYFAYCLFCAKCTHFLSLMDFTSNHGAISHGGKKRSNGRNNFVSLRLQLCFSAFTYKMFALS